MSWRCPNCGLDAAGITKRHCEACGFTEFGQLLLITETGQAVTMNIDTDVGRNLLETAVGDGAKYVSPRQFRVVRDATLGAWAVEPSLDGKNPTYLNGVPLTERIILTDGSVLSVGPARVQLTVSIKY